MSEPTGSLSIQHSGKFFTLWFVSHGWMAGQLLQFLDEVIEAEDREVAILKLLGYTMTMSPEPPPRRADQWVEVYLDEKRVATNSPIVRKAVKKLPLSEDDLCLPSTLERIYGILDQHDFKVELY